MIEDEAVAYLLTQRDRFFEIGKGLRRFVEFGSMKVKIRSHHSPAFSE